MLLGFIVIDDHDPKPRYYFNYRMLCNVRNVYGNFTTLDYI